MQISKKLDSLRTCFCVVVKLCNVHEKSLKKKHVNSSQMKITNFHFLNIQLCLYRYRKMSQLPLFSDLKIILSLATYAVCQSCIVTDCCYDCNKTSEFTKANHFFTSFSMSSFLSEISKGHTRSIHHYFFRINKLQPARINTFQPLICFDLLPKITNILSRLGKIVP